MDEAGALRKKASQKGKKEGGSGEKWGESRTQNGRSRGGEGDCQQGRRTGKRRETEGAGPCSLSPEPAKPGIRGADHIISCLPYGFRGT